MKRMTLKDKKEFTAFCKAATNAQLVNIYEKEHDARRGGYALIAKMEIDRRNI